MSNAVFPTILPGLQWNITKAPLWSTLKQRTASGRESRVALMSYPLYEMELSYDVLRSTSAYGELQTLLNFYLARQGAFDNFLFEDTYMPDNAVTDQLFATGDGVTTQYRLSRNIATGGFIEPVMNVKVLTNIKDNGVTVSGANYTVSNTGLVTFSPAILAGHALTWTGTFYYRCRFDDKMTLNEFMQYLFELRSLKMVGCLGVKV